MTMDVKQMNRKFTVEHDSRGSNPDVKSGKY